MKVYQLVLKKMVFKSSNGFSYVRLVRLFQRFNDEILLGDINFEYTSSLYLNEKRANEVADSCSTCSSELHDLEGSTEIVFRKFYVIPVDVNECHD